MNLGLGLGFARRPATGGSPPAPDLDAEVEAFLSGSTGFALDPSDLAVLFRDAAGTTPVTTSGQSVGRVNGKWGTAASFISQSTGAAQPVWSGSAALTCDEVDDEMRGLSGDILATFNNVTAAFGGVRFRVASLAAARGLFMWNTTSSSAVRFSAFVNTDGSVGVSGRRLDADSAWTFTSATGLVTTGVAYTVTVQLNYSTGAIVVRLDGSAVITDNIGGSGNTSATNSNRTGWGLTYGSTRYAPSRLGRGVVAPKLPSAGELTSVEAWLAEVAL